MSRGYTGSIQMHLMSVYAMTQGSSYVTGRQNTSWLTFWPKGLSPNWSGTGSWTLLQIRPYKRTQKEKDVQAMISQPESKFQDYDGSADDAASIPKVKPNHKNRKNKNSKRGNQYRSQEVGGIESYLNCVSRMSHLISSVQATSFMMWVKYFILHTRNE